MLELSLRIKKKLINICMNISEWACEIGIYDPRKYEPFQTKAFI